MSILNKQQAEWQHEQFELMCQKMAAAGYTKRTYCSCQVWDDYWQCKGRVEIEGLGLCNVWYHGWYKTECVVPYSCGHFINNWGFQKEDGTV